MTGTVSELCDNYENEGENINSFDLFSLWLFGKTNNNQSLVEDSCSYESILKNDESTRSDRPINVGDKNGPEGLCNII